MSTDEQRRALVREFFEALSAADWETLRSLVGEQLVFGISNLSPDQLLDAFGDGAFDRAAPVLAEHFEPGGAETGVEQFIGGHRSWREHHAEEYRLDHLSVEADGRAVYLASVAETHVGMYFGYPPTGEEINVAQLGVLRVEGGRIREHRISFDNNDFLVQMGMIPRDPYQAKVETQFYRVMNRVLRHNLRNDLSTIGSYAELAGTDDGGGDHTERIRATVDELLGTVNKVRRFEQRLLDVTQSQSVDLPAVVESVVARQREVNPAAEIRVRVPDESLTIMSNEDFVRIALAESIENGVEHAEAESPRIDVTVAPAGTDDYAAVLTVEDDGPGLPADEVEPLSRDVESALDHASGVGLWAIKWSIERLGGEVEFAADEPSGSVVTLLLPDSRPEEAYMY